MKFFWRLTKKNCLKTVGLSNLRIPPSLSWFLKVKFFSNISILSLHLLCPFTDLVFLSIGIEFFLTSKYENYPKK